MPNFRVFGGGSSSSYNAIVEHYETDNKVHQTYSASSLGLPGGYQHREVVVSSGTMSALADASWANRVVKNVIPHGAGNQRHSILATSGESWARMHLGYEKYSGVGITNQLKRAQKFQGGNCSVHAAVASAALKSKGVDRPISRMRIRLPGDNSHELVMLGDHRAPHYGERNTVVVDAWPAHPSASTLDQTVLHDASSNTHMPLTDLMAHYRNETWDVSNLASRSDMARLTDIKVMNTDELQRKLRKEGLPSLHSSDLVRHALNDDSFGSFDVRINTDPSTTYTRDSAYYGRSFDYLMNNNHDG
ncbi:hypothetical protein [Pantoea stewartii]|uniref:Type III effector n=1 Tax=Pantoea stewartii subsp. stewartii DC283 TaxID=660596 RepID=H3RKQ6_PANSE|nr:hypothetical protein [Pantoea stewartii]ARF52720.1 hypothetical protein DSJ_26320 [Pantoea stewartii subsp. stewartii DC283]EHT98297.1 hypothetical protein CKS_2962 [Pantoea stewartii subsp. stewartii DC283]KAB0545444.1 hypothetical protein F7Q90_24850 [Pantoea stewartii subsp. stewartii]